MPNRNGNTVFFVITLWMFKRTIIDLVDIYNGSLNLFHDRPENLYWDAMRLVLFGCCRCFNPESDTLGIYANCFIVWFPCCLNMDTRLSVSDHIHYPRIFSCTSWQNFSNQPNHNVMHTYPRSFTWFLWCDLFPAAQTPHSNHVPMNSVMCFYVRIILLDEL